MKLVLFFSRGISLDIWETSGLLDRELMTYKKMLNHIEEVSFITYDKDSKPELIRKAGGIKVLGNRTILPVDLFSILCPILFRSRIRDADIYKTNQINGWWAGGIAKFLYHKPLVVRCGYLLSLDQQRKGYNWFRNHLVSIIEKRAFKYADASIVTTHLIKEEIIRRYRIPSDKINVIPNPVDTDLFRPAPGIEKVSGRLCFIGRLSPEKNVEMLIRALSGVKDASLLIIGDGELRSNLELLSARLGIHVSFLGNVPNRELPKLLNTCQAFVLPSKWEGMPKVVIEAMACGLVVIGTDVPGIREVIKHGITGLLCKPEVNNLQDTIITVLKDSNLRDDIGHHARDFVVNNFTLEQNLTKELDLLTSLAHP